MEKTLERPPLTKEKLEETLHACLKHPEPLGAMIGVAKGFLVFGYNREQMKEDLAKYGLQLRVEGKGEEEDLILDVIDCLYGFCHPNSKL